MVIRRDESQFIRTHVAIAELFALCGNTSAVNRYGIGPRPMAKQVKKKKTSVKLT